jgi:hypothetical protein
MKGIAKGVYPVNTGKVQIGCMYLPKRVQYCTEAELFWQGVLLGRTRVRPSLSTSVSSFFAVLRRVGGTFVPRFHRSK